MRLGPGSAGGLKDSERWLSSVVTGHRGLLYRRAWVTLDTWPCPVIALCVCVWCVYVYMWCVRVCMCLCMCRWSEVRAVQGVDEMTGCKQLHCVGSTWIVTGDMVLDSGNDFGDGTGWGSWRLWPGPFPTALFRCPLALAYTWFIPPQKFSGYSASLLWVRTASWPP